MAYIKSDPNQNWLIPLSIKDMIPENHISFLVEDLVNELDFSKFDKKSEGVGAPSYHPKIAMKILIQGMVGKVRSSRKLSSACRENFVFMYLSEKTQPNFCTIARFRRENASFVKEAFKKTIDLAITYDLVDLNHIAIDGTTIKANAGQKTIIKRDGVDILDKAIEKMIQDDIELDKLEEEMYGDQEINLTKLDRKDMKRIVREYSKKHDKTKIKEKINKLKKEFAEKPNQKRLSLTDPDSGCFRNKKKYNEPSYNAQFSVDDKHQIIVANDVCDEAGDFLQLIPQVNNILKNVGPLAPGTKITGDCGYGSANNYYFLERNGLDGYIPNKAQAQISKGNEPTLKRDDYEYDHHTNEIIDNDIRLQYRRYCKYKSGKEVFLFATKGWKKKKEVPIHFFSRLRMKKKLDSVEGKEIYAKRKHIVEPVIGNIKQNLGFREFLTREINSVKTELNLVSIAHNLQKIWKYGGKRVGTVSVGTTLGNLFFRFRLRHC